MKKWMQTLLMFTLIGSTTARAHSLTEIADFADRICANTVGGEVTRDQISGKIDANLPELAKVLGLKLEADGSLTHDKITYSGIPLRNLPPSIPTPAQCKTEITKMLLAERTKIETTRTESCQVSSRTEGRGNPADDNSQQEVHFVRCPAPGRVLTAQWGGCTYMGGEPCKSINKRDDLSRWCADDPKAACIYYQTNDGNQKLIFGTFTYEIAPH